MNVQARADNSTVPFIRSGETFSREVTFKQDAGRVDPLVKKTLLGRSQVEAGAVTPDGGNTGDGTVTGFAIAAGGPPREGSYNLECIAAVANGGTFKLEDPDGNLLANDLVMTAGAGAATVFIVAGMTFIITDGAADFIVGDKFTLDIDADGDYVPFDVSALNGGQVVAAIFLGDDIPAADIVAGDIADQPVLVGGKCTITAEQLVIEGGATLDTVIGNGLTIRENLYRLGIFAEDTVDIDELEN
jgi:hypothetical protein